MSEDLKPEEEPKGSFILVWIFMIVFAVYYFLNWKYLAALWYTG